MLKKTITYTDYDGNERSEDHYFNLTKAEITDFNLSVPGGFEQKIKNIINAKDIPELAKLFKEIIAMSYGKKSDDGKRFIKSKEITEEFFQTEAYSQLYMSMITDDKVAAEFIHGIVPKDVAEAAIKLEKESNNE